MMDNSSQIGYHTCKLTHGFHYIVDNAPFKSENGDNQWLTQGFYFWTDSEYWAKKWGKVGQRAIGKFKLELCLKNEVLDLVGNVSHQIEFSQFIELILEKFNAEQRDKITVNQVIAKLRQDKLTFPYLGVKAQDQKSIGSINFIDSKYSRYIRPKLSYITRQQLCVFEEAKDRIHLNGFIEPADFAERLPAI